MLVVGHHNPWAFTFWGEGFGRGTKNRFLGNNFGSYFREEGRGLYTIESRADKYLSHGSVCGFVSTGNITSRR